MNWVWTHSRSRHGARLVLLAIADCASGDGTNAWPSIAELKRKAALSEGSVHTALRELVTLGELAVEYNAGPKGCNRYRVLMPDRPSTPPAKTRPPQKLDPPETVPPQNLGGSVSAQLNGHTPLVSAPPSKSVPSPQNLRPGVPKTAPVTVNEPSRLIDQIAATANKLAVIPGDDDLILKATIGMIHQRTAEVIDGARARFIAADILTGRRTRDPVAYVRKAIRNEPDPRGRWLTVALPADAGKRDGIRQSPLLAAVPQPRPDWCRECDERTRMTGEDTPRRCPNCHPLRRAS
jgi:hypothetical protein